jgi:hypothetical protein
MDNRQLRTLAEDLPVKPVEMGAEPSEIDSIMVLEDSEGGERRFKKSLSDLKEAMGETDGFSTPGSATMSSVDYHTIRLQERKYFDSGDYNLAKAAAATAAGKGTTPTTPGTTPKIARQSPTTPLTPLPAFVGRLHPSPDRLGLYNNINGHSLSSHQMAFAASSGENGSPMKDHMISRGSLEMLGLDLKDGDGEKQHEAKFSDFLIKNKEISNAEPATLADADKTNAMDSPATFTATTNTLQSSNLHRP